MLKSIKAFFIGSWFSAPRLPREKPVFSAFVIANTVHALKYPRFKGLFFLISDLCHWNSQGQHLVLEPTCRNEFLVKDCRTPCPGGWWRSATCPKNGVTFIRRDPGAEPGCRICPACMGSADKAEQHSPAGKQNRSAMCSVMIGSILKQAAAWLLFCKHSSLL